MMHDVLIVGGGVIGLSLAWDLARHGRSVHVIDQGAGGREASWAGAVEAGDTGVSMTQPLQCTGSRTGEVSWILRVAPLPTPAGSP